MQEAGFPTVTSVFPARELALAGARGSVRHPSPSFTIPGAASETPGARRNEPITTTSNGRLAPESATGTCDNYQPVATLRGAPVEADGRRIARVLVGAALVALAVAAALLYGAGAHRNAQVAELRAKGVAVQATVSGCRGQLGGSGSNAAGYHCTGSFELGGRRFNETLPGAGFRRPGSPMVVVTVPGDPGLLATRAEVAAEQPDDGVFVLPSVLAAVAAAGTVIGLRRTRRRAQAPERLRARGGV